MLDKTCIFEHNYRKLFFISLKKRTNFRYIFWQRCRRTQESRSETLDFNYQFISQQIIFQCFNYCGRHIHFQNSLINTSINTCHFKKVHNDTWLPLSLALFPLTLNTNLLSDRPIFTIACLYYKWIELYMSCPWHFVIIFSFPFDTDLWPTFTLVAWRSMAQHPEFDGGWGEKDVWGLHCPVPGWSQLSEPVLWELLQGHWQLCTGLQGKHSLDGLLHKMSSEKLWTTSSAVWSKLHHIFAAKLKTLVFVSNKFEY